MRLLPALLALILLPAFAWADDDDEAAKIHAGAKVAAVCSACHSLLDTKNKVGPSLMGVYGGKVAAAEGFVYSDAMKVYAHDHPIWDDATLNDFLADPRAAVPGNKMAMSGIKTPEDRANVIAFLKAFNNAATLDAAAPAPAPVLATAPAPVPVAPLPPGDAARGATYAQRCLACHSVTDKANKVGPSLLGIYGRPPNTAEGFAYSEAFSRAFPNATAVVIRQQTKQAPVFVWDDNLLNQFLADPQAMVPHNKMGFAGISDPQDRADVIAYLKSLQ